MRKGALRGGKGIDKTEQNKVPVLRPADRVIAICCSDIHLSEKAPVSRSVEEDWLDTQKGYLDQLRGLSIKHNNAPIICGGDVFDRWNSSARLINYAIANLPKMYSIVGQHDLPHHRYEDIKSSAYWTLVETGTLVNIGPGEQVEIPGHVPIRVHGFPWGSEVRPLRKPYDLMIELCLIHAFVWVKGCGYMGAPKDAHLSHWKEKLSGYDSVVIGDNHKGWLMTGGQSISNCGTFIRRKADEIDYQPAVGLLRADGTIKRVELDTSGDKFIDLPRTITGAPNLEVAEFLAELSQLGECSLSFCDSVMHWMDSHKVERRTREVILKCLEGVK